MKPRGLAARRLRLFKSASQKRCRHLVGLPPLDPSHKRGSIKKMECNRGSGGFPPWAASLFGGEGGTLPGSTGWIIQMISYGNR